MSPKHVQHSGRDCLLGTYERVGAAAEHLERALIKRALALCEGNGVEAAKMLGLSRKGLYLKRQRFGLE